MLNGLLWTSVASSADGTKLVAVENNGQIYTSTNSGASWTLRVNSGINWTGRGIFSGWKQADRDGQQRPGLYFHGFRCHLDRPEFTRGRYFNIRRFLG